MSNVDPRTSRPAGVRRMGRSDRASTPHRVLNTGCGPAGGRLHRAFSIGWSEVRLDIDAGVRPDLVGTIRDMRGIVADSSFDAIWASHNLEHLHGHEVLTALKEFRRVLRDDGFALVACPDLEAVAEAILSKGALAPAYMSPAGPITALEMLYGHGRSIGAGNTFMCHHTGFTVERLGRTALEAGFVEARVAKGSGFDLWALLLTPHADLDAIAPLLMDTPERYLLDC